ncbi:hypothetical protein AURDEDRAFT_128785 [Auricularia subglabra TFB-10046 SS5]|nr:hypothetical protein AURDEDRAFT_128785 [Auricularia subglabra TFB-10046 SS5]
MAEMRCYASGWEIRSRDLRCIFSHFPAATRVDFPGNASFEHPAFHSAISYRGIKDCVWRSGGRGATRNLQLRLAATRHVEFVTIYNPLPEEILALLGHLSAPLTCTYCPGIESPEDEFELLFVEHEGARTRCRAIVDGTALWTENPESHLRRALRSAVSGAVHTLRVSAPHWASLVKRLPPLDGVQRLHINIQDEGAIPGLTPVEFALRDLRMIELEAPSCLEVWEMTIVDFALGSFDPSVLRETALSLINVHLYGDMRATNSLFGDVQFIHDAPCQFNSHRPE